jgi:diguanylate cyclase (GGDEF)-like protein
MDTHKALGRLAPNTVDFWLSGVLAFCAWFPAAAPAACLANPDPDVSRLQALVAEDAAGALKQVQIRLDALEQHSAMDAVGVRHLKASWYSVQADAYSILELDDEARAAAAKGLTYAGDERDPVHLALLTTAAESTYDEAGINNAIKTIEAARVKQIRGSLADNCLLITRGLLEHRQDRSDLAIVSVTQAYRGTVAPNMSEAHILSAEVLSIVMRGMGDYAQALALNQEKIDWDTAHHATLSLSVSRFMRGQVLGLMKSYDAAIVEFAEARKLSVQVDDQQGVAFADLRICDNHIELGKLGAAREECASALRGFSATQSADSAKDAQALLARIDLGQGHADRALAILNGVLDHNGADMPPRHVASLYEWRARANAALRNYRDAYNDLTQYVQRFAAANDTERNRQAGALRARFETDREIERNTSLERELTLSQQQSNRQREQLRVNAFVVIAGVLVIALLIYFLIANLRYRQQLVKLASLDGLTGLPNRRRTAELAMAALQAARAEGRPLTIAIIDMDHFKIINDRCGHATGDFVLREFARAGRESSRQSDILGRWGGEEFLLVMPEATLELAVANLERLRTLVFGIRLPATGSGLRVSMSAGLAAYDESVKSLDDLIARADSALYAAKNDGRDMVRIADLSSLTATGTVRRSQRQ